MDPVIARQAARRAHDAMVSSLRELERAEQNAVLRFADILNERHFLHLGFSSIWHYAMEWLGFSKSKTGQFVRLAKDVKRLPELKTALEKNEIEWTKAREVGKVATVESQREWINRAKKSSRCELERDVKRASKKPAARQDSFVANELPQADPPVRVTFELTSLELAELEKLTEGLPGSRTEQLLAAFAALRREKKSTRVDPTIQI